MLTVFYYTNGYTTCSGSEGGAGAAKPHHILQIGIIVIMLT